ncbi:MAG: S-methyl-5'-thioadenosine phosphorylase, partial [Nitrosopumilaceae archaeon]
MEKDVEIGIFGGTGIYDSGILENAQDVTIDTPFGKPSDS